jgi:amino acid adenylation domain-containing protein
MSVQPTTWLNTHAAAVLDMNGPVDVPFEQFDEIWLARPLVARFDEIAERRATRLAVSDGKSAWTYAELRARAHALTQDIAARCRADRPVGILLPQDATFPVAALACLAARRAYVPIDVKHPAARIEAIVREGGLGGVIVRADAPEAQHFPADVPRVDIAAVSATGAATSATPCAPACLAGTALEQATATTDNVAVILYTSGSTGKPKGIGNSQRAILQRVMEATNSCHIHPDDKLLLLSSPGSIAGQREMFAALLNGASLHITDPQADGVHAVLATMQREGVTLCYAVPSLLRMLLRLPHAQAAFAHMRVVRIGGDVTLASDLALFRGVVPASCRFFASFSSTETPAVFQWFVPPSWQADGARVPIGHARPGCDFTVLDDDGQTVPQGEIGELVVRSPYLALGQWQDGRLVPGRIECDPQDPALRIFHTGDLVRQRPDGLWELFGRKDRLIKIHGQRIDTGEVEAVLRGCAGVTDVVVMARQRGEETVALAAFVVMEGAHDLRALKQALQARVPAYMHPADIRVLDAIPQLPGFKPDMAALEKLDQQLLKETAQAVASSAALMPAPQHDAVDSAVRYAWCNVLGAKSYAANQSWDEANADSLKAVELRFYIEDRLGVKLPFEALQEDTRPDTLATAIRALGTNLNDAAAPEEDADMPVVFLFPGIQDDDPPLARLRMAFSRQVRFRLIDYPSWHEMVAAGGTLNVIVDAVMAKIHAEPPCASYRVAGYSFGGVIAFEVASRLIAAGQQVDFLGLLDTRRWDLTTRPMPSFHRFLYEDANWRSDWLKAVIAALIRQRRFGLLDTCERLLMTRPNRMALWLKRRITRELRYQAFLHWKPAPLAVPTELYLSNDHWPGEPADYGWDSLCQPLRLVPIGGDHATVIQSPQQEKLCDAFLSALGLKDGHDSALTTPMSATDTWPRTG